MILRSILIYLVFVLLIWMFFPQFFLFVASKTTNYQMISLSISDSTKLIINVIIAFTIGFIFIHTKFGYNAPLNLPSLLLKSFIVFIVIFIVALMGCSIFSKNNTVAINDIAKLWILIPLVILSVLLIKRVEVE